MMKTGNAATGPLESFFRVTKIAHYETIFPPAFFSSGTSEVTWWWGTVVYGAQPLKIFYFFNF